MVTPLTDWDMMSLTTCSLPPKRLEHMRTVSATALGSDFVGSQNLAMLAFTKTGRPIAAEAYPKLIRLGQSRRVGLESCGQAEGASLRSSGLLGEMVLDIMSRNETSLKDARRRAQQAFQEELAAIAEEEKEYLDGEELDEEFHKDGYMTERAVLEAMSRVELTDLEEQTLQVWREGRLCQDLRLDVEALRAERRTLSDHVDALRQERARLEEQVARARSASFWAAKQAEDARSAVG